MSETPEQKLAQALADVESLNRQLRTLVQVEQRHYRSQNELNRQLQNMRTLEEFARACSGSDEASTILHRAQLVIHSAFTLDWVAAFIIDAPRARLIVASADPPLPGREFGGLEAAELAWLRALPALSLHHLPADAPDAPLATLLARWWPVEIPPPAVHPGRVLVLALHGGAEEPTALLVAYSTEKKRAMYWPADLSDRNTPFLALFANHIERALENAALTTRLRDRTHELSNSLAELERTQASLVQAQKLEAIGRLAGGVAHEFNNLLTVVMGHTALLRDALAEDDARRDNAVRVLTAARQAETITRQLLAFGRRQVQVRTGVDLEQLAGATAHMLGRLIGEHVQLTVESMAGPQVVWADPTQMEQVLLNLVLNARDAMPRGGRIRVVTRPATAQDAARCEGAPDPAKFAVLEVIDEGEGMDADTRGRIFEPFFTTKEPGSGSGLGLAVVHGIVHQSEGHVLVESAPGRGARFTVLLPRGGATLVEPVTRAPVVTTLPPPGAPGGATILLVEDEAMVRYVTRQFLENAGYTVIEAADGEQGLAVFRENRERIDLLLSDVIMPRMGGVRLAEEVARERPGLPVILMSGYARPAESEDAGGAPGSGAGPACESIHKPFRSGDLVAAVRAALLRRA